MSVAPPPRAALHPRDDTLGIKLILPLPFGLGLRFVLLAGLLGAGVALELLARSAEELAASFRGA